MYTMVTTIKITEKNRRQLFQIKNKLEKESNQSLSYNDVVEVLIKKFKNVDKRQLVEDLLSIKGILSDNSAKIFEEMRSHDKARENRYISH